jgi:hypothetical protein
MGGIAHPTDSSVVERENAAEAEGYAREANMDFERRLADLHDAARKLPPGSDEETQDELGLILQFLPTIERTRDAALLRSIELAVHSLLAEPPNRLLAIRLRESAQQGLLRRGFFRSILPGTSASTWVIAGMMFFLCFGILLMFFVYARFPYYPQQQIPLGSGESPFFIKYIYIPLIPLAGALGSVVSILVRIRDFSEIRILNPPALFWTGFFKPIIGATFALFVFAAIGSSLISVNPAINQGFMFLTLGFIAGFSERFAPDLVSRIEGSAISGNDQHLQSPEDRRPKG